MNKILVIGDSCQDIFEYGECNRLSPEAPVPIFTPTRVIGNGGMAINVVENLKALGYECDIITNDIRPVKTRYIDDVSNQMLLRVDTNDSISERVTKRLKDVVFSDYVAIVISDYDKGFVLERDIKYITERHDLVFLDTKKILGDWVEGVEFLKLNNDEFHKNSKYILNNYSGELIITKGKDGASHWFKDYLIYDEHPTRDLSGAGDTFLATFVGDYIKNGDIVTAIKFANKCAAWVVTQKGVVPINPNKINYENIN